ncbi:MAG: hypothetical protein AB1796_08495 [Bacillota bacterium]
MSIIPKHIWEGVEKPDEFLGPEAVIGCGPFRLMDYSKGMRKRPEADLEILRGLGFQADVIEDIPRWETFIEYLKYGYFSGEEFMLKAVKK